MFDDVDIKEIRFDGNNKITILVGGFSHPNPKEYMDQVVSEYVSHSSFNEFIEIHLDMPQIRIILKDINRIDFDNYDGQHLCDWSRQEPL